MKWPRGRYNGGRIVGVHITISLDVLHWGLRWPNFMNGTCAGIGPLRVWVRAEYE